MTINQILEQDSPLAEFVNGYLEAMLWSSSDIDEESNDEATLSDQSLSDAGWGIVDIAEPSLKSVIADCEKFFNFSHLWIREDEQTFSNAGFNLWLTRAGHGSGFWDGDYPIHGDRLTELTRSLFGYSRTDPYSADGQVWIMGTETFPE